MVADEREYLVLDVETLRDPHEVEGGWGNPGGLGVGCAVLYDSMSDGYSVYQESTVQVLRERLAYRTDVHGAVVVGHNLRAFDLKVIFGNRFPEGCGYWGEIDGHVLDLMEVCLGGRMEETVAAQGVRALNGLGLESLAYGTLARRQYGGGKRMPELMRRGEWGLVVEHCLEDVRLTRRLYLHARDQGWLMTQSGRMIETRGRMG